MTYSGAKAKHGRCEAAATKLARDEKGFAYDGGLPRE